MDIDIETIITKNSAWEKFPIAHLRAEGTFPRPPSPLVYVSDIYGATPNLDMDSPDWWKENFGMTPDYVGGVILNPDDYFPYKQVVFSHFTLMVKM